MSESKIIKEEDKDLWYQRMGERIPKSPEDYPHVGLMEWMDIMLKSKID